ncbi:Epithelial membrane protein 3 [Nibea albiflora]|uniref:Epithelial membrane protein 3 n=1 Tax=Nibea albiflora TaxID=240163 RepID=A0ACB7F3T5_NIBAL|nr:Epithelial membrane protein 3 [Nibea albiflora]
MVFLLISLPVLHLVTLAMLLIATLEKSWWVWTDSEIRDLWYNCFHNNATETWMCASTNESGLTTFAACLIFTFHRKEILNDSRDLAKGRFGYCFILAWLCVPLLLISGVLYVHLRKKQ